ncbi:MAG TPA: DUF3592 domain-containing protein [Chthoniobacterales bacterium]
MRLQINFPASRTSNSFAGKLGVTLFFGLFFGLGSVFFCLAGMDFIRTVQPYFWSPAPARILSGEVVPDGDDHKIHVRFRYSWQGRTFESATFSQPEESFNHYDTAFEALAALPAGTETTCRVNPKAPEQAVLRLRGLWMGFVMLIPLIFVAVGGLGMWGAWARPAPATRRSSQPVKKSRVTGRVTGAALALAGAGLLAAWAVPMWLKAADSTRWPETPCVILSSCVKSHSDSDGTTYSVAIAYRYTFEGREYRSDRFDLMNASSSGRAGKEALVARYPAGSTRVCYVDPDRPSQALLRRGFTWSLLLGLIPLALLLFGLFLCFQKLGKTNPAAQAPRVDATGLLKSKESPGLRLGGTLAFALFWNGLLSVFLLDLIGGFRRGQPDWFLALFLCPFVLIGLAALGAAGYYLLALGNPRIRLRLETGRIEPGAPLKLAWQMDGAVRRLERLVIYLEGREEATYTRGTSSVTDKRVFFRQPLADVTGTWMDFQEGRGAISIPREAPPSFRASHNRIVWSCQVWGKIPFWPGLREEFEIPLQPPFPAA